MPLGGIFAGCSSIQDVIFTALAESERYHGVSPISQVALWKILNIVYSVNMINDHHNELWDEYANALSQAFTCEYISCELILADTMLDVAAKMILRYCTIENRYSMIQRFPPWGVPQRAPQAEGGQPAERVVPQQPPPQHQQQQAPTNLPIVPSFPPPPPPPQQQQQFPPARVQNLAPYHRPPRPSTYIIQHILILRSLLLYISFFQTLDADQLDLE